MKKFIKYILPISLIFIVFQFKKHEIKEKNTSSLKKLIKIDEKSTKEDIQVIKDFLLKFLEKQINDSGFINKYCIKKTVEQVSIELSNYYNKFTNISSQEAIKLAHEMINNCQAYIAVIVMQLEDTQVKISKEYKIIEDKYRTGFFEWLFDDKSWKTKLNLQEIKKINELEDQLLETTQILKTINRIKALIKFFDWSTYSNSPFAWLAREFIGF